jgi:hypothetical protein
MSDHRTWKGSLAAFAVGVALTGLIAEGVLRFAMPEWRDFYSGRFMQRIVVPDFGLVTTGRPGFDGHFAQNNGDFRVRITINDFGLRNPDPVRSADGRVWIVGDSMAFGWGVEQDEIYSSVIGRLVNVPTYNVASPGTDVCGYQALVARMPRAIKPRAVILGLILENDVAVYDCRDRARRQEEDSAVARSKPSSPLSWMSVKGQMRQYSAFYNFLTVSLKRVDIMVRLLVGMGIVEEGHEYRRTIDENVLDDAVTRTAEEIVAVRALFPLDMPFAVLIAPVRFEIKDNDAFYKRLRLAVRDALRARGIAFIDPYEGFVKAGFEPTHFVHDGHWSALGHKLAGEAASRWLASKIPNN